MKSAVIGLGLAIAVLGGFYGGYKVGVAKAPAPSAAIVAGTSQAGTGSGNGRAGGGFAGGAGFAGAGACPTPGATGRGTVTGTITASGSGTLTIHDARCNTDVKVTYTGSTPLTKVVQAQSGDLTNNVNVLVVGQRQSDGSVTATQISIQPPRQQAGQ
jgi:hypothetical protein